MTGAASTLAPLAITSGEPAGIGPDLFLQLAVSPPEVPFVVIADKDLLHQRAAQLGLKIELVEAGVQNAFPNAPLTAYHSLPILHAPLAAPCRSGVLNPANSAYVLAMLRRAVQGCRSGEFSGMVTAPVHKGIINDAGIAFTGHTEFLAELAAVAASPVPALPRGEGGQSNRYAISSASPETPQVVMMLVGGGMRVALATTHLPLRAVAGAITQPVLESVLRILHRDLQRRFGIARPRIFVAGLNPHAGEGGHLGREEIEVMIPVLDRLRAEGMDVSAPLPADTLFAAHRLKECDAVLAMYHDQGLPVLKHASFGEGVNVTLGLPIIRTSVDHGTALELAGTGRADVGSLREAIRLAAEMARNERA